MSADPVAPEKVARDCRTENPISDIEDRAGRDPPRFRVEEATSRFEGVPWLCPPFPASCPVRFTVTES